MRSYNVVATVLVAAGMVAAVVGTAWGDGRPGWVTVSVPGAMSISVYCGGETRFADGEHISFSPEQVDCDIEAPLSPVMPLRGRISLSREAAYLCDRDGMDLVCHPK